MLAVLIADLAGLEVMFHTKADNRSFGFFFFLSSHHCKVLFNTEKGESAS